MLNIFKSILYFILLAAEFIVGVLLMSLLWNNGEYIAIIVTCIIWAALIIWQVVMLVKAKDVASKGKIKRNIAIFMLTPVAIFIITLIWFIIGLSKAI